VSSIVLKGTVIDAQHQEVLIGASVVITGNSNYLCGTSTDHKGKFQLKIDSGLISPESLVEISYTGYITRQIPVDEIIHCEVISLEAEAALQEIEVIKRESGYSNSKKANLAAIPLNSVNNPDSSILDKEIWSAPVINIYPNPFIDFLTLEFDWPAPEKLLIRICKKNGAEIFRDNYLTKVGAQSIELKFPAISFSAGSYIITVENSNRILITEMISKV